MTNTTYIMNNNTVSEKDYLANLRSLSRSRSKSPGLFSSSTVSSRQRQRSSVDYTPGQYQFSKDLPPPPPLSPRPEPEPDWNRRPSQAFSDDSKMSSFKSSIISTSSSNSERKRSNFKKSTTYLNGPTPIWLETGGPTRGC